MNKDLEKSVDGDLSALDNSRRAFLLKLLLGGCVGAPLISQIGLTGECQAKDRSGKFDGGKSDSEHDDEVLLFSNGKIYIDADRKVKNLLVKNGKVAGWNVQSEKYPSAVTIDLKGASAYPGFIDSHVHLMEAGTFFQLGADLFNCADADAIAKKLAEKVKFIPEGHLALGVGFSLSDYDKWSIDDLAKIDKVTGSRPTFLVDKLGHNAVINSATMKAAGLLPTTPVPPGGKMIVEDGGITGMLRESAMTLPWDKIFPRLSDEEIKRGTLKILNHWASIGYTGAVDLMGAPGTRFMKPGVFHEMEKEKTLPLRINYCYTIFNLNDVDDAAKYIGKDSDMARFLGCKIFIDGAYAGGEAWTSWKNKQGNYGLQEIYTDDSKGKNYNLNRIVARVEEHGMNMHYHVQGDMAIGAVLDALEKVEAKKGKIKGVHTLIHLAFPTDEQISRIKKFNGQVVTTVQPGFWPVESDTVQYYGELAKRVYPVKKLIDSGVSVGISTDFSVSPLEYSPPTVIMGVAATGGGTPDFHLPVGVRDIVHGLTSGSAKTTGRDDTGKLDVGYKADIVVYDKDLYSVSPEEFTKNNPKVLSTWVNGKKAYQATS
jgi:predicted amidohydrolase YtcJ